MEYNKDDNNSNNINKDNGDSDETENKKDNLTKILIKKNFDKIKMNKIIIEDMPIKQNNNNINNNIALNNINNFNNQNNNNNYSNKVNLNNINTQLVMNQPQNNNSNINTNNNFNNANFYGNNMNNGNFNSNNINTINFNNMNNNFINNQMNMNNNVNNNIYNNINNNMNFNCNNNYNFNNNGFNNVNNIGNSMMTNQNTMNNLVNINNNNINFAMNNNNMNCCNMNMNNNFNCNNFPINSFNSNQANFNNNQIIPFSNPQVQNNMFFNNNNMFNTGNFNFNNNYLIQNMQNNLFQQVFFKFFFQQFMLHFFMNQNQNNFLQFPGKAPIPDFQNCPELQKEFSQNQKLIDDVLEILREPNIKAKNDGEIIKQLNSPDIISGDLTTEIITEFLNLDPNLLNGFGNKLNGKWAINETRGGLRYNPPLGWVGFGLNVINKYDNKNNDWLACDGRYGEWCVGYHGTGRNRSNEEVRAIIKSILTSNLQPGKGQAFKNDIDFNHRTQKVGIGVYCSPDINVLEEYAGFMTIRGKKYKVGIMIRCKRDKIRIPMKHKNYWVLDGNFNQLRPYRLLIKEVKKNNFLYN